MKGREVTFGYVRGSGLSLWFINWVVQRVCRLDAACNWYNKHFTTRVMHSQGLEIEGDCPRVLRSLAVSGGCYINAADGLHIGRGTIWAPNVAIVSQDHGREDRTRAADNRHPYRTRLLAWLRMHHHARRGAWRSDDSRRECRGHALVSRGRSGARRLPARVRQAFFNDSTCP